MSDITTKVLETITDLFFSQNFENINEIEKLLKSKETRNTISSILNKKNDYLPLYIRRELTDKAERYAKKIIKNCVENDKKLQDAVSVENEVIAFLKPKEAQLISLYGTKNIGMFESLICEIMFERLKIKKIKK